jgi:hypothetical protein
MNVENGTWEKSVEVPFYEYTYTHNNKRQTARVFYSMMGVIRDDKIFLSFPIETGYSLLILSSDSALGADHQQRTINVDNEELHFNIFNLSEEGILSALLLDDWQVRLAWWRTDRTQAGM